VEKHITKSFEETQEIGQNFAREILAAKPQKSATVLALQGDLGAGKTTFLQGFAKGLGIEEVVNSPTFIVMKRFKIYDLRFKNFYHFDLYRLENEKDADFLNFQEIMKDPKNIIAIEWPEKISKILGTPSLRLVARVAGSAGTPDLAKRGNLISIIFNHLGEHKREIKIIDF